MNGPPYQTIDDVIDSLKKRGMYFEDEEAAKRLLEFVGAWRLRPYWHPFENKKSRAYPRKFIEGTTFERVRAVYEFDRELKLAVFAAVERVEVAMRAIWARAMYRELGPGGYAVASLYASVKEHRSRRRRLRRLWNKAKQEEPMKKYDGQYGPLSVPPVHYAVEMMSFGELVRWMNGLDTGGRRKETLKYQDEIRRIASDFRRQFALPYPYVVSSGRHLRHVRNLAAHHARMWDRAISCCMLATPRKSRPCLRESMDVTTLADTPRDLERARQGIYRSLTLLAYLSDRFSDQCQFRQRMLKLMKKHDPPLRRMAFPEDWRERPVWKRDATCKRQA